jgi:predicted N-acetyltransferase YhbS
MFGEGVSVVGKPGTMPIAAHGCNICREDCVCRLSTIDGGGDAPYALAPQSGARLSYAVAMEQPEHDDAIERVLDRAFGPGRYAKTSERVRERGAVLERRLSRVALNEAGRVIGVCRIWRAEAGASVFFLGPLAVDPAAQSAGLGFNLTQEAVAACRAAGGNAVILVGAEPFFRPAGFTTIPHGRVTLPGPVDPARLLWLELRPGGLDRLRGELKAPST